MGTLWYFRVFRNLEMPFRRPVSAGLILAALPLLAACTQTPAPVIAPPGEAGESGVLAAIRDAQRTQARHKATSTVLNHASSLDPTGLSGYAVDAVEEAQERIEEEKYRRIDEEVEKAIAEGEALKAQYEERERQKAGNAGPTPARRKPVR